jgi:hypothetical protein
VIFMSNWQNLSSQSWAVLKAAEYSIPSWRKIRQQLWLHNQRKSSLEITERPSSYASRTLIPSGPLMIKLKNQTNRWADDFVWPFYSEDSTIVQLESLGCCKSVAIKIDTWDVWDKWDA